MANVKPNEIIYRYVKVEISDEEAINIGNSLKQLYLYIDNHANMGRIKPYGNAYKIIRDTAQTLSSRSDMKVSKREVKSLIQYFNTRSGVLNIKVPYKLDYIFKAIFKITDQLKVNYPLPADIENQLGKIRRDCFYNEQSKAYKRWFNENIEDQPLINRHLYDDIFAPECTLGKKF